MANNLNPNVYRSTPTQAETRVRVFGSPQSPPPLPPPANSPPQHFQYVAGESPPVVQQPRAAPQRFGMEASARPGQQPPVLEQGVPRRYLIDNSKLQARTRSLGFRKSKRLEDLDDDDHGARWHSLVEGIDHGDGWLQVGELYLPFELNGVTVVRLEKPKEQAGPCMCQ